MGFGHFSLLHLLGQDFVLETDHRALKCTMNDTYARITYWFLDLQPFKFQVQHRAGKQNMVADFLSRHPGVEPPEGEGNGTWHTDRLFFGGGIRCLKKKRQFNANPKHSIASRGHNKVQCFVPHCNHLNHLNHT